MQPVIITTRIYYPERGAAAYRLRALAKAIAKDAPVRVLTGQLPEGEDGSSPDPGVTISRAPVLRDTEGFVRGAVQFASFDVPLFFRLLFSSQYAGVISEPPPTTGTVVRLACALRGRPYVYYSADVATDAVDGMVSKPMRAFVSALERFALRGASAVIAVNDQVGERVAELGANNVVVVQNGVDTDVFTDQVKPLSKSELAEAGVTGRYFIYTGTASKWQGAELFAKALLEDPQLVDYQLIYFSQGDSQPQIEQLAKQSCGRVLTHPLVAPQEAARWLAGATAAVVSIVPGQGYDYAYPTKLYAAWACGTPTVFAGVGPAAKDIRTHGLGVVCDYDERSVAAGMRQLAQGRTNRKSLRNWVHENRSLVQTGRQVASAVRSVISRSAQQGH